MGGPELPAPAPERAVVKVGKRGLQPLTLDGLRDLARVVLASGLAPASIASVEKIVVALAMGAELGLPPMQALSAFCVINGRATLYGDALVGIVLASGLVQSYAETLSGEGDDRTACVRVGRKGVQGEFAGTFAVKDARKAGLWGKAGPWSQYPDRMLKIRARAFALRDGFGDVLRGFPVFEEMRDVAAVVTPAPPKEGEPA